MNTLQILVWILMFMICYDLVSYFVSLRSESEPTPRADNIGSKWNSTYGYDGSGLGAVSQWMVGTGCLLCLFLLRLVIRRTVPKSVADISRNSFQKANDSETKPKRRESFLTCRISDTTINSYTDDQTYDFPGQLSPEQLQVLLEELKFRTDEKFEGIEAWMEVNDQDSKLWLQRLERLETEISYMRHQIFILMSNNSKVGSTVCVGGVTENRDHVETLRDLSKILAQVKKQFKEDETKAETRNSGDHEYEDYACEKNLQEENDDFLGQGGEEYVVTDQEQSYIEDNIVSTDTMPKQHPPKKKVPHSLTINEELNEVNEEVDKENQGTKFKEILDSEGSLSSVNKEEPFRYQSDKDDSFEQPDLSIKEVEESVDDKLDAGSKTLNEPNSVPKNENNVESPPEIEINQRPPSPQSIYETSGSVSPIGTTRSNSPDESRSIPVNNEVTIKTKNLPHDSTDSPSLNVIKSNIFNSTIQANTLPQGDIQHRGRCPSPRRTVRFAQERRDLSPSKTPTWLGINTDPSLAKQMNIKGVSDIKMHSSYYGEVTRGRRDSISCPVVERQSRRTILERELINLERRVSPSPTRPRQNRRSHIRSKVADYIRGTK